MLNVLELLNSSSVFTRFEYTFAPECARCAHSSALVHLTRCLACCATAGALLAIVVSQSLAPQGSAPLAPRHRFAGRRRPALRRLRILVRCSALVSASAVSRPASNVSGFAALRAGSAASPRPRSLRSAWGSALRASSVCCALLVRPFGAAEPRHKNPRSTASRKKQG